MAQAKRLGERTRQAGTVLALLALLAGGLYGGDFFGIRETIAGDAVPAPRAPAVSRVAGDAPAAAPSAAPSATRAPVAETRVRSWPWWQTVTTAAGEGPRTVPVTIDSGALQWRVRWTCNRGDITIAPAAGGDPLVDGSCPDGEDGYATTTGPVELEVRAGGAWEVTVEQQLDVPLVEEPLPAMTAADARRLATGTFADIDQSGRGTVTAFLLPDGRQALRLDDFFVTPNVDLEIRVSPLAAPDSTEEYLSEPSEFVAPLDTTAGSMNFSVPDDVDVTAWESVVIWCPPALSAYAYATLQAPG